MKHEKDLTLNVYSPVELEKSKRALWELNTDSEYAALVERIRVVSNYVKGPCFDSDSESEEDEDDEVLVDDKSFESVLTHRFTTHASECDKLYESLAQLLVRGPAHLKRFEALE